MSMSVDFHLDPSGEDDDRWAVTVYTYGSPRDFATVKFRSTARDFVTVYAGSPDQSRDLAAALVAAARDLDEWADTVDPDPIVSNYDAMTVGSPTLAPRHGKANCLAIGPDGHMCSRPAGHTGQHVAEGISTVQAVWPQDKLAESAERLIGLHEGAAS